MASSPTVNVRLEWDEAQRFDGAVGTTPLTLDGDGEDGLSPVQMLAAGLAGCMALDVLYILAKMRTPADALSVDLTVERARTQPRRVVAATMSFTVTGDVPGKNVQRALDMSRDTYCSVWHSLREDIPLETSFEIVAP